MSTGETPSESAAAPAGQQTREGRVIASLAIAIFALPVVSYYVHGAITVQTTPEGAMLALDGLRECTTWMAGIITAAMTGLALLVFKDEQKKFKELTHWERRTALASFVFLGLGLFAAAWILSGIPSLTLRIHAQGAAGTPPPFDIYEMTIYTWMEDVPRLKGLFRLGAFTAWQHFYWATGLLSLGLHVLVTFHRRTR